MMGHHGAGVAAGLILTNLHSLGGRAARRRFYRELYIVPDFAVVIGRLAEQKVSVQRQRLIPARFFRRQISVVVVVVVVGLV
eukprot:SAG31_NODE_1435_length_8356_cov_148.657503_5_plen_82_part_00